MLNSARHNRKERVGVVVSDKMDKTIIVRVASRTVHPIYKRVITKAKKFKVHDEKEEAKLNDKVVIVQTRPISKDKHWRLLEVLK